MALLYPSDHTELIAKAREYAHKSLEHTLSYWGWHDEDNTDKQLNRITSGVFGQYWLSEVCRLNDIPYELDNSAYTDPDEYDLLLGAGRRITDVKSACNSNLKMQINAALKTRAIDTYCFLFLEKDLSKVEPYGFISKPDYYEHARFIPEGAFFPGTGLTNRFNNGSYILELHKWNHLVDFEEYLVRSKSMQRDIDDLRDEFGKLRGGIHQILEDELPCTAIQLPPYQGQLSHFERSLSDLKLEIATAIAGYRRDFGNDVRANYNEYGLSVEKIKSHQIELMKMEGKALDIKYKMDTLEALLEAIDGLKWSCVEQRKLSQQYLNLLGRVE
jgi:hypothetical protein